MSFESVKNSISSELNPDNIKNLNTTQLKNELFSIINILEQHGVGFKDLIKEFLNNTPIQTEKILESAEKQVSELSDIASVEFNQFAQHTATNTKPIVENVVAQEKAGLICKLLPFLCPMHQKKTTTETLSTTEDDTIVLLTGENIG